MKQNSIIIEKRIDIYYEVIDSLDNSLLDRFDCYKDTPIKARSKAIKLKNKLIKMKSKELLNLKKKNKEKSYLYGSIMFG